MKGWLTALVVGLLGALGFYRERSRRLQQTANNAEAETDALSRQSEALREQEEIENAAMDDARDHTFTTDDINIILRDNNKSRKNH